MELDSFILLIGKVLLITGLVMLNGFFVAAEFALVKIRDTQLDPLVQKGHRRAKLARRIISNLDTYISTTQLGITLAGLALGALVAPVYEALLSPFFLWLGVGDLQLRNGVAVVFGFFVNTFLLIVMGELAPKALAIRKTLPTTLWVAQPLILFNHISYPFIWVLNQSAQWVLRQVGIKPVTESESSHSQEELRLMYASSQRHLHTSRIEREIVLNAMDLPHRVVREVMRPRQQIVGLSTENSIAQCLEIAEKTRYSRFPLCEAGDLDRTLGVIHIKDIYAMRMKAISGADLAIAARKIIYVPESARLEKVLQLMLDRRLHIAIVVDEYGGTVGLLSLENIIEELVGQIQDEFDQETPLSQKTGENTWQLDGALPLHGLSDILGRLPEHEEVATVSGLVTLRCGGFPKVGDTVRLGSWELKVQAMDGLRVSRLTLTKLPEDAAEI
jgi:CBS domain containing-hemolysin-like protein